MSQFNISLFNNYIDFSFLIKQIILLFGGLYGNL